MIKCYIALGNLTAASRALQDLKSRDPNNSTSYASENTNINRLRDLEANADKDMNKSDFRRVSCLCLLSRLMRTCSTEWECSITKFNSFQP